MAATDCAFPSKGLLALLALLTFMAGARAELRVPQPRVDLGAVRAGPSLVQRFPLINDGTTPVEITDTKASCGCLKPRVSQQLLQPGEQGWVEVEVNTLSQPAGPNAWRVDVKYRTGGQDSEASVLVTATLSKEISVEPAALTISTDQAISHEICVTDHRARPLTVTTVQTSSPQLRATLQPACKDAEGHVVQLVKLEVAAGYPEGRHDEVVSLFTDDPAYAELKVTANITRRIAQRLSAAPADVTLSAPKGQPLPSRIVLLRDREGQAVQVDSVTADHPAVTCRWAQGPNNLATVRILVDASKLDAPTLQTSVHVHVRQPVEQVLTIPVSVRSEY